jgi:hypothetical protein
MKYSTLTSFYFSLSFFFIYLYDAIEKDLTIWRASIQLIMMCLAFRLIYVSEKRSSFFFFYSLDHRILHDNEIDERRRGKSLMDFWASININIHPHFLFFGSIVVEEDKKKMNISRRTRRSSMKKKDPIVFMILFIINLLNE